MSPGERETTRQTTTDEPTESHEDDDADAVDDHLQSLDDGAGCTEIWEHLSESREE
ncbi:hypothetical protein [Halogeometricum limi]|uniref:Uncharacterized protein n=1 Tax=Halogeometricum limi TaxID=555875 RepID=A0A1I6H5G0_9EURY|nr:hypothetical protein [Halogeometricum limi]SFR49665.1 hypothetical protein SAMN04488124_1792 [Halogeometricum limi]